jgi:hypothetical protein
MRHVFFVINFTGGLLLLVGCVIAIASMESFGSLAGGVVCLLPIAAFLWEEWRACYRGNAKVMRGLGIFYLCLAGLALLGLIANLAEAIADGYTDGLMGFAAVGLIIVIWFAVCGGWRIWATRSPVDPDDVAAEPTDG